MKKVAIYNPYLETRGGGEKVCLSLAETIINKTGYSIDLIVHEKVDLKSLEKYFELNLENAKVVVLSTETALLKLLKLMHLPGRAINLVKDYYIRTYIKKNKYDLFINNCYQSNMPAPIKNSIYMCMFPQKFKQFEGLSLLKIAYIHFFNILNRALFFPSKKLPVHTYKLITANSEYTRGYIKEYWGVDSNILYPICENMDDNQSQSKEKIILNVGRFFANSGENHHKRQDFMIDVFSELKDLASAGWELHFAGSVAEDQETLKYLLDLLYKTEHLPIKLHFNRPFAELKDLYNRSSIYWHATGYGSDPSKYPEKQEHFGITTVEAMSAGCIPVVLNSAGQKETVVNEETGFLWSTKKELINCTRKVTKMDESSMLKLSSKAKESSKKYNRDAFSLSVSSILQEFF